MARLAMCPLSAQSSNSAGERFLDGENIPVIFSDMEPPRIKCPSVKERIAEPNKLTVRVSWETPEGRDTADGILTE